MTRTAKTGALVTAAATAAALLALTPSAGVGAPAADRSDPAARAPVARGGPQAELDRVMALQPGGIQVSDNAVVWGDGDVVLVVPSRGQAKAPAGLGTHVRRHLLDTPGLRSLDTTNVASARGAQAGAGSGQSFDTQDCPGGAFKKDYYCFYQYRDWGGRRVQFTGDTKAADAADWGFNNGTTSWVSNDVDCTVKAYNAERPSDMSNWMWKQPENSSSSYVGSDNDNKMSFWTCNGDG